MTNDELAKINQIFPQVGREIERLKKDANDFEKMYKQEHKDLNKAKREIDRLLKVKEELKDMLVGAEIHRDEYKTESEHYHKVLEWVKQRYEDEWTYEMGTGEVVDEIINKFESNLEENFDK